MGSDIGDWVDGAASNFRKGIDTHGSGSQPRLGGSGWQRAQAGALERYQDPRDLLEKDLNSGPLGGLFDGAKNLLRDVLQLENGAKYVDLNVTGGKIYGFTAGVIYNRETGGMHVYGGFALTAGASMSLTFSEQSVTPGWNVAAQVNWPSPVGGAFQKGLDPSGRWFTEAGIAGGVGGLFSITGFYVSRDVYEIMGGR